MTPITDFINKVHQGNNIDILKEMPDESVDCMITDPQYALVSGEYQEDKEFTGGFMGKYWDSKLPSVDTWKQCLRVLKHGAFAFIMCSPRQDVFARMIINLQDGGFKTNFTSIYHTYSSGFPKCTNISLAIDRKACREQLILKLGREPTKDEFNIEWKKFREVIGQKKLNPRDKKVYTPNGYDGIQGTSTFEKNPSMNMITAPSSEEAKNFDGAYTFSPKPAVEIIITVMKPLSEKSFTEQCLKNGHGVVYFRDCRIPFQSQFDYNEVVNNFKGGIERASPEEKESWRLHEGGWRLGRGIEIPDESKGRFPANLLVSDDILDDGKNYNNSKGGNSTNIGGFVTAYADKEKIGVPCGFSDSGSYSRYFSLDAWLDKQIKNLPKEIQKVFPFLIVSKASKSEREEGCDDLKERIKPIATTNNRKCKICGKQQISGSPCKCPNPEWEIIIRDRETTTKNIHPTCKPLKLFSYLTVLGRRPNDIVLDPFAGSGTLGVACHLLNRNFICIDIEHDYVEIAKARIGHIQSNRPHVQPMSRTEII